MSNFWKQDPGSPLSPRLVVATVVAAVALLGGIAWFLSVRYAVLIGALVLAGAVFARDMRQRKSWQASIESELVNTRSAHDRLVREVARGRNEVATLREGLAVAGNSVRSVRRAGGADAGMAQAIAAQLSALGQATRWAANDAPDFEDDALDETVGAASGGTDMEAYLARHIKDDLLLKLLHHALRHDKIDVFMQPVVSLPQRKIQFHEIFSRIQVRPDIYIRARRYIGLAGKNNLIPAIDNLVLLRCLQQIREMAQAGGTDIYFCNITPQTLSDSGFMGDLVEFITQHRNLAQHLVFELSHGDLQNLDPVLRPVIDGLAKLGCRFSMDSVRGLALDTDMLGARHVRFVKISAKTLLSRIGREGGLRRLQRLKAELDRAGIDMIVEKIEDETALRELLDLHINYGQGFLFGEPERKAA